jgi:histone H2A
MPPRKKGGVVVEKKKKRHRKRDYSSFSSYIYKVMKQTGGTGITTKAMAIMNSFVQDMFDRLAKEAARLAKASKHRTMTSRDIQSATRLLLGSELAKHAVSEGTKAVTKYNASQATGGPAGGGKKRVKGTSRSTLAGIGFPVGRIHSRLRDGNYTDRIGSGAPVYLAAVLEYLCAEILELSNTGKVKRIKPRHIMLAIRNDEELDKLFRGVMINNSGALPYIDPRLLPPAVEKEKKKKVAA